MSSRFSSLGTCNCVMTAVQASLRAVLTAHLFGWNTRSSIPPGGAYGLFLGPQLVLCLVRGRGGMLPRSGDSRRLWEAASDRLRLCWQASRGHGRHSTPGWLVLRGTVCVGALVRLLDLGVVCTSMFQVFLRLQSFDLGVFEKGWY